MNHLSVRWENRGQSGLIGLVWLLSLAKCGPAHVRVLNKRQEVFKIRALPVDAYMRAIGARRGPCAVNRRVCAPAR